MGLLLPQISTGRRGAGWREGGRGWLPGVSQEPHQGQPLQGEQGEGAAGRKRLAFRNLKRICSLLPGPGSQGPRGGSQRSLRDRPCPPCRPSVCRLGPFQAAASFQESEVWGLGERGGQPCSPSPYLFIHSFQYTKHFRAAMETSVATESETSCDQWQAGPGRPSRASGSVARTRGPPCFQSGPQSGISLPKGRLTGAWQGVALTGSGMKVPGSPSPGGVAQRGARPLRAFVRCLCGECAGCF